MVQRVRGVALVVANPTDEILILQEFVNKPHLGKYRGMFSIPMETSQPGESDLSALQRLKEEELPGVPALELPGTYIGVYRIVSGVWVRLYKTEAVSYRLPNTMSNEHEVGNYRWIPIDAALSLWLRQGAREMLSDYACGCCNVLRRYCSTPTLL